MTVTAAPSVNNHVGNGVTTVFAYGFKILQAADLKVTVNGVIVTNYTVSGVRDPAGGSITFTPAPANGAAIRIARNMAIARGTDYQFNGALPADTLNDDQDSPVMMIQQVEEKVGRAVRIPETDNVALNDLPVLADRANKLMAFDSNGQPQAISSAAGTATQLALDLLSSIGSSLVGFIQAGTGAVARPLQAKARDWVAPEDFGAVGNGVTDDTTAINNALATGKRVVGDPTKVYAVTGNITLPATTRMRDCAFIQLSPNNAFRRTLTCSSATLIDLRNVTVNINGDGSNGTVSDAAGIWLASCNKVILEHCEVFGNGYSNGIVIVDCDDARINAPHIHDMTHGTAVSANPLDDRINGLWLIRGNRAVVVAPRINDLLGRWSGQAAFNRYTRGITVSGTRNFAIIGGTVENVDQGIDITGSENSERFAVIGLVAQDCYTWGMKCSNTVTYGVFSACQAWRCGIAGFVASPPSSVLAPQTQFIEYIGCQAVECGSSGVWQASANVAGFSVLNSGTYPDFPRNVRFIGCSALADGAAMEYGFISQTTGPGGAGDQWVEVVDCTVSGSTVRDYDGLHQGVMRKSRSAAQSLTHNTVTAISMDGTAVDRMGTGSNATDHTILRSGTYQISGYVEFAANATGVRQARVLRNGVVVAKTTLPGMAAGATCCPVAAAVECEKNDIVILQAFQDSGGALNVTDAALQVALLRPGRGRT